MRYKSWDIDEIEWDLYNYENNSIRFRIFGNQNFLSTFRTIKTHLSMGTSLEPWQPIEHSKNEQNGRHARNRCDVFFFGFAQSTGPLGVETTSWMFTSYFPRKVSANWYNPIDPNRGSLSQYRDGKQDKQWNHPPDLCKLSHLLFVALFVDHIISTEYCLLNPLACKDHTRSTIKDLPQYAKPHTLTGL